jgi:nicotinate-nucleotide pyrophosphorylase (carboxylating)
MELIPMPQLPYLNEQKILAFIDQALAEDIGDGDHSTLACIPENSRAKAIIEAKSEGIVAGIQLAEWIFKRYDSDFEIVFHKKDGDFIQKGDGLLTLHGATRAILSTERLALNALQRMSGIATYTHHLQQLISHTRARLLDTRKTTPLVRMLEKWAVHIGGGMNHRFGLFDMIMLKDTHIDMVGGIIKALDSVEIYKKAKGLDFLDVVVETRTLKEVAEAMHHPSTTRILLDNMPPEQLKKAVELINGRRPTEASGGITEKTIVAIAETGVDFISVGALTHSYKSLDISLYSGKR